MDNQGLSANHPELTANTGSERKETPAKSPRNPRSLDNKTVGKAKRKQRGQGNEHPPPPPQKKGGRIQDRTSAFKPKPEPTPKEEIQARNNRREQNAAAETPMELNPQEQQEVPKDCDQTTCPARAGVGQTDTAEGDPTTKGSRDCTNSEANVCPRHRRPEAHPPRSKGNQKENRAQHPQRQRTAGGAEVNPDRTTNKALKARGAVRHYCTAIQREVTTSMAEPRHRVQNLAIIGKPAGAGEALRTQGKGRQPNGRHQCKSRTGRRTQKSCVTPEG